MTRYLAFHLLLHLAFLLAMGHVRVEVRLQYLGLVDFVVSLPLQVQDWILRFLLFSRLVHIVTPRDDTIIRNVLVSCRNPILLALLRRFQIHYLVQTHDCIHILPFVDIWRVRHRRHQVWRRFHLAPNIDVPLRQHIIVILDRASIILQRAGDIPQLRELVNLAQPLVVFIHVLEFKLVVANALLLLFAALRRDGIRSQSLQSEVFKSLGRVRQHQNGRCRRG